MKTTIDSAGRLVVPKPIRDALGLAGGQELEIAARAGHIEIDYPSTPMKLEQHGRGVVAVPDQEMPELTAAAVRDVLETTRR